MSIETTISQHPYAARILDGKWKVAYWTDYYRSTGFSRSLYRTADRCPGKRKNDDTILLWVAFWGGGGGDDNLVLFQQIFQIFTISPMIVDTRHWHLTRTEKIPWQNIWQQTHECTVLYVTGCWGGAQKKKRSPSCFPSAQTNRLVIQLGFLV